MGIWYNAVSNVTISLKDLRELCPKEVEAVEKAEWFESWYNIAWEEDSWSDEDEDEDEDEDGGENEDESNEVYLLQKAFEKATTVGDDCLKLSFGIVNTEYSHGTEHLNDENGCLFIVENVQVLTKPAEKFLSKLSFNEYVEGS